MNWHERIAAARERLYFTEEEGDLAHDWVTCACGQQDPRIERSLRGVPSDTILRGLGSKFGTAVQLNDFDWAEELLAAIEKRAAKLLKPHAPPDTSPQGSQSA